MKVTVMLLLFVSLPALAEDRLAGVGELLFNGRASEARIRIIDAQIAYRAEGNPSKEALCFLFLGLADATLDDVASARANLDEAVKRLDALGDSFGAWLALWMRMSLERNDGHFATSLATCERALALLAEAAKPEKALSLEALQTLSTVFGQPIDILEMLGSGGPPIVKTIFLPFAEAVTRDTYGDLLTSAGHLDRAEVELTKASALQTVFGNLLDGSIAQHFGDLRRRQWRFAEAREEYLKALHGVSLLPHFAGIDQYAQVYIYGKLAELEMLDGRIDEALAWNDKELAIVNRGSDTHRQTTVMQERANVLMRFSRFGEAERILSSAMAIALNTKHLGDQASILSDLGGMNMLWGRYGTAAEQLEKAVVLFHNLKQPLVEATVWMVLGQVYALMDAGNSADLALERAKALAKISGVNVIVKMVDALIAIRGFLAGRVTNAEADKALSNWFDDKESGFVMLDPGTQQLIHSLITSGSAVGEGLPGEGVESWVPMPNFTALSFLLRAKAFLSRGDMPSARALLNKALETNANGDLRAGYLALVASTYWREGNADEAISYLTKSAAAVEGVLTDVQVEELVIGYLGDSRRIYVEILIEQLLRQGRVRDAFDYTERARARAFLQVIGSTRIKPAHGTDEPIAREAEALRVQIAGWERQRTSGTGGDRIAEDLQQARQRYSGLRIRAKAVNPEYSSMTAVEPLTVEEVQQELDNDTTIISYFVSEQGTHAWIVGRNTVEQVTLPFDAADRKSVVCWSNKLAGTRSVVVKTAMPQCKTETVEQQLHTKLFAPLRDHIHTTHLVIVPHGVLHYVPFAALQDARSGRYLVEEFTITYAPSASSLGFLHRKETPVDGRTLVLGDPNTGTQRTRLPGAKREAIAIAKEFGTRAILGRDATEELLYGLYGKVDLLHIAAHADYDVKNPLFSGVALAPSAGRDGRLEVHEILSDIDLTGVNLVVLSACSTAAGERSGGDEITGLTRSLLYAGAPGVISTLWDIDDDAAAVLMNDLYSRLLSGASVAEALRDAQRSMLQIPRYRNPRFWAAFNLTGDPRGRWRSHSLPN